MNKLHKHEAGQSIVIITFALVALVALLALVVDAGNAYVQRRTFQNAMDAGARAGTIAYAQGNKTIDDIDNAVKTYVQANSPGIQLSDFKSYFIVQSLGGSYVVLTNTVLSGYSGHSYIAPVTLTVTSPPLGVVPIVGVQVQGNKTFNTFFAGVVGFKQMQTGGAAGAYVMGGVCNTTNLFPLAFSQDNFDPNNLMTQQAYDAKGITPYHTYYLNEKLPGDGKPTTQSFVYVTWNTDATAATLVSNMDDPTRSGAWRVSDLLNTTDGRTTGQNANLSNTSVRNEFNTYINKVVTIPVYGWFDDSGTGSKSLSIKGFVRFKITGITWNSTTHQITGYLQDWLDPVADGGCTAYGGKAPNQNPPPPPPPNFPTPKPGETPVNPAKRNLVGTVHFDKITLANTTPTNIHVPVDVVSVIDLSASMANSIGKTGGTSKLTSARNALNLFNNKIRTDLGDQASLVAFPSSRGVYTGASYPDRCKGVQGNPTTLNKYQEAGIEATLGTITTTIHTKIDGFTSTRGNTPTASAVVSATQILMGPQHRRNAPRVMILATDGRANVTAFNNYFSGDNVDFESCNQAAVDDVSHQALTAKGDTDGDGLPDITIFVVAVGWEWNESSYATWAEDFKSWATIDTDATKPHFFTAYDDAHMQSIYDQIATQVQDIAKGTCEPIENDLFAPRATFTARNIDDASQPLINVTTTADGTFAISDLKPGTYVFENGNVTVAGTVYNQFTHKDFAAPYTPSQEVGVGSETYKVDLYLKATNPPHCP